MLPSAGERRRAKAAAAHINGTSGRMISAADEMESGARAARGVPLGSPMSARGEKWRTTSIIPAATGPGDQTLSINNAQPAVNAGTSGAETERATIILPTTHARYSTVVPASSSPSEYVASVQRNI